MHTGVCAHTKMENIIVKINWIKMINRAGKMVQWLITLAVLTGDLGLIRSP